MAKIVIGTARFALSAWVGAAALFVVTAIREVRVPQFDSVTRDLLVGIRFPAYYAFGFTLVGISGLALAACSFFPRQNRRRLLCVATAVFLVLALMLAEYQLVYLPLLKMITPPGQPRPADFVGYHEASKWLNFASMTITAIIAFYLSCTEFGRKDSAES